MPNKIFNKVALTTVMLIIIAVPITLNAISEATMMFLAIEPGSRANGMGNAYVGVVDDAYAGWWNVGATAFNKKNQFAGMHTNWLAGSGIDDLYYEYFGYNMYLEEIGNLGFNVVSMNYGTIDRMGDSPTEDLPDFMSYEFAVGALYSTEIITDKIGLGLGFKFLYSDLGPAPEGGSTKGKTMTYAFDIGSKFKNVLIPRFDIGTVLQNIGPDVTYIEDSDKDPLPMTLRLGLSYRVFDSIEEGIDPSSPLASFKQKFTISADGSKILANRKPLVGRLFTALTDDDATYEVDSAVFSLGAEYNYLDLISLRTGYFYDKAGSIIGPSFGVGFHYTFSERYRLSADFAMVTAGELVDYNKTFSLGLEY